MTEFIQSLQNDKVKNLVRLQKKPAERKKQGLFVVEGRREVSLALNNNIEPKSFFICDEIYSPDPFYPLSTDAYPGIPTYKVSADVYDKIAYRGDTQGIIMIAANKNSGLSGFKIGSSGIILVLESIEKPGNLGAVFRTADASGIDAIIICGQNFDIYNPNVIRSSLGCIFTKQIATCSNEEALAYFRNNNFEILAAHPDGGQNHTDADYNKSSAIVLGTESEGLSEFWKQNADKLITIPMMGQIDSLNISVSAAVIAYEALRQRR